MPYQLYEYIPNRILFIRVWGVYSSDELVTSNQEVTNYMEQSPNNIINITDFTLMRDYPKNVFKLANAFTLFGHPKHDWQIVISSDKMVSFISNTVIQIAKRANNKIQFKIVATEADVFPVLTHIAPNLSDLPPLPPLEPHQRRDAES